MAHGRYYRLVGPSLMQVLSKVSELTLSSSAQQELISQFLINEQGFDVDFGEHGLRMAAQFAYCEWQISAICAEIPEYYE